MSCTAPTSHSRTGPTQRLPNATLKIAIDRTTGTAERKRAAAIADFPEFAAARDRGRRIKDHVIAHLDHYLREFERNATRLRRQGPLGRDRRGGLPDRHRHLQGGRGAKRVTRSKSMLGEEIGLPHALARGRHRARRDRSRRAHHPARRRAAVAHRLAGDAQHPRAGRGAVQGRASSAARQPRPCRTMVAERPARAARRSSSPPMSGISGANFLDRRHRRDLHRHQRGQCRADHHPAARAHRAPPASRSWCRRPAHAFALLRLLVRSATGGELTQYTDLPLRPEAARRRRRAGGDPHRPGR